MRSRKGVGVDPLQPAPAAVAIASSSSSVTLPAEGPAGWCETTGRRCSLRISSCPDGQLGPPRHARILKEDRVDRATQVPRVGDLVVISGHRVGESERTGEILELLGEASNRRFRVRWDEGHESMFYPGSDATIRHSTHRRASTKEK